MAEIQDPEYKAVFVAGSRTKTITFRSKRYAKEYLVRRAGKHLQASTWLGVDNWGLVLLVRLDASKEIYRKVESSDDWSKLYGRLLGVITRKGVITMHLAGLPSLILAFSLGALADGAATMMRDRRRRKLHAQKDRG